MNRCLSERALLGISAGEGTAVQHAHLRMCADCAERYDALTEDLKLIGDVLVQVPPAGVTLSQVPEVLYRWVPVAAAAAVLLAVGLAVTQLHTPAPLQVATRSANVPAFAADVSAAVFASDDDSPMQIASDTPYLRAALEAGLPCAQVGVFEGECDDQISALALASD